MGIGHRVWSRNVDSRSLGFTLIELLVVVLILGMAAGIALLSVNPGQERLVAIEVDRLAALFRLAQSEAKVGGRPLAWRGDLTGYRFLAGETVRGEKADDPLRPRAWPFDVQRLEAPNLVFGLEPLLVPAEIRIVTGQRELVLTLDAFGNLTRVH